MTAPLVSVVLPVYNGAAYLPQAIESVMSQSLRPIELVAVDDGSTDASPEILAGYGERVTVVRQANAGVAAARNAGIERARGEFVAFLDQDDWWLSEKLARQVALFRAHEDLGLVHTAVASYDDDEGAWVGPLNPLARPQEMAGECYRRLLFGNPIANSSVMVRRHILKQVGMLDLRIRGNTVQDYDLWLRIAARYHFGHIAEKLTVVRLHSRQGHHDLRAMLSEELKVLLRHRSESEWRSSPDDRRRLANLYDELATAHFEAGDAWQARRRFANALRIDRSGRRFARFGASCLPYPLVGLLRRTWQGIKQQRAHREMAAEVR